MHETNLKKLDLNLLVALNALLEEKHITRAAGRVHLSQPAMSRALSRLRVMFNDALLVKSLSGMTLTARANELYQPLQLVLREITDMVKPPSFDPATMRGEVVIATRDYELVTILSDVIKHINAAAPFLKLRVVPLVADDLSPLDHHQVDFVLGGSDSKSATLHRSIILEESFSCIVAKNNSILKQTLNLSSYLKMKHCLVTISNFGMGIVDRILSEKNLTRDIAIRIPHFLAVGYMVENSHFVATLPDRLGKLLAQKHKITLFKPPLKLPTFPIYLYWHTRNHQNPIHQWVRNIIQKAYNNEQ
jgi:DNA-binding transcriptional LysR family regulator